MIVKNLFEKFSNLWEYLIESLLNLLYATTAGIAAKRPRAVAKSASAIPGATMAKLVFLKSLLIEMNSLYPKQYRINL